jgi:hypothetical protein
MVNPIQQMKSNFIESVINPIQDFEEIDLMVNESIELALYEYELNNKKRKQKEYVLGEIPLYNEKTSFYIILKRITEGVELRDDDPEDLVDIMNIHQRHFYDIKFKYFNKILQKLFNIVEINNRYYIKLVN